LDIKYTPIGDDSARTLGQLKQLAMVKLYGTNMNRVAADALQTALPQAEIDYRRGAFLGVACDQPPMPCTVIQVVPNTGAALAGLLEGDVIVEYAGKKIADFNDLKELIGTNEPGDSVELQVARGGTPVRRIVSGGGADLGVTDGKSTPLGLEVKEVADASIAARLGVRSGDIIRRFDERPVDSVDALDKAYRAVQDDQQAFLEVVRDVRLVKAKVTFGEWQD
jgi:S1-C subfamily serine protease